MSVECGVHMCKCACDIWCVHMCECVCDIVVCTCVVVGVDQKCPEMFLEVPGD